MQPCSTKHTVVHLIIRLIVFSHAKYIKNNLNVLEEVINILFYIAEADGNVSESELNMIQKIAQIFGITQTQ
ncbi:MAG: TerB family tellurite resistance protein, partial [SAR324 cluster bacterium]|nr:TerB family tellurite resistance protein [SAR324 cluster bacterium]